MSDSERDGESGAASEPGVPFGRYNLLRKIATGGMAQLYLATMSGAADFKKFCVVKKILPHLSEQEHFVEMFLDEARIAARLNHPNIVQIYDLGRVGSAYFIAMEYIQGEDLAQLLSRSRKTGQILPVELCARIAADVCAGLHYAHEQRDEQGQPLNIVHRDVSPQNVLVTYEGQIKIVDFGIAKAANKVAHTRTGTIMGKAAYMSPEQCLGETLDRRSDVFAVGILLHELLTLRRLYKRDSELLTLRVITEEDAPPVAEARPGTPEVLTEIVGRALRRPAAERFQSCLEMRQALESFIADFGVPATSLELGALLEEHFPDHIERKNRLREAGSLSEVIRALPSTGIRDMGTPSSSPQPTMTQTRYRRGRSRLVLAGTLALAALLAGLGLLALQWKPAPQIGQLVLTSAPVGAQVSLDGVSRGTTPLTVDGLEFERAYILAVAASGYKPHHANLLVTSDRPTLQQHVALETLPVTTVASLQIETSPPGAHILLDRMDTGQVTPATLADLPAGVERTVRLELDGYRPEERRVLLRPGDAQKLELQLTAREARPRPGPGHRPVQPHHPLPDDTSGDSPPRKATGLLTLRTRPWTRVYHGSIELGETPLFKVELPVGPIKLRVVNPDKGIDSQIVVEIQAEGVTTVDRSL
ncbi:MAG: serine/threonine-protein kinase [Pseudomonadota bacterium]